MVNLRNMACAYIMKDNKVLMMKRNTTRELFPDIWTAIGGHLEEYEINHPAKACLREIKEEVGIDEKDIFNFKLKYITMRRKEDELRIQYIYFANTHVETIKECDEGKTYWISENELNNLKMSYVNTCVIDHYNTQGKFIDGIFVGIVEVASETTEPKINWTMLNSFDSNN